MTFNPQIIHYLKIYLIKNTKEQCLIKIINVVIKMSYKKKNFKFNCIFE